jgi:hypothetical protein
MEEAGFTDVQCTVMKHLVEFDDGGVFVRLNAMALVGMSADGRSMNEDARKNAAAQIAADSQGVLAAHTRNGKLACEFSSTIATGVNR